MGERGKTGRHVCGIDLSASWTALGILVFQRPISPQNVSKFSIYPVVRECLP